MRFRASATTERKSANPHTITIAPGAHGASALQRRPTDAKQDPLRRNNNKNAHLWYTTEPAPKQRLLHQRPMHHAQAALKMGASMSSVHSGWMSPTHKDRMSATAGSMEA